MICIGNSRSINEKLHVCLAKRISTGESSISDAHRDGSSMICWGENLTSARLCQSCTMRKVWYDQLEVLVQSLMYNGMDLE